MTPQELDVIVRVGGATLLILAAMASGDRGGRRNRAYFVPLAACLCGFLAGNTPDPALRLSGLAGQAAHLLAGFAAVALWWFCLAVFDRAFKPRGPVLAAGLVWIAVAAADRGVFGAELADAGLSWLLIGLGLGMVGHLAWRLISDRKGDLIEDRRDARLMVVLLLAGQLLADLLVDVVLGMNWRPQAFSILQNAGLLGFTGWLVRLNLRGEIQPPPREAQARSLPDAPRDVSPSDARLLDRLRRLVEDERVALDPNLNFDGFVRMRGASERTVRHLINRSLGYDHFRAFLNAHRMNEARRLLSDPARRRDKLISIAMDSGFASLASFNRVFQDTEACTPSAYRERALSRSLAHP